MTALESATFEIQRQKARSAIFGAVKRKEIIVPEKCEQCGKTGKLHGHHPDYSRPLFVQWLCPACHAKEHKRIRAAAWKAAGGKHKRRGKA